MRNDKSGKKDQAGGESSSALDAFLAELSAFAPEDARRIQDVEEHLSKGDVDGDPTWFVRFLTEKQIRYGLMYMDSKGDWKLAAKKAGYSAHAKQDEVEGGPAMFAYMKAVKKAVADQVMISAELLATRFNRLALQAETRGQIPAAVQANTRLAEMLGLLDKKAPSIHVNGDGAVINIGSTRSSSDDDDPAMEAVWREVEAQNNIKALPEASGS